MTPTSARRATVAAVAVLALVVSSCGGSGDRVDRATSPLRPSTSAATTAPTTSPDGGVAAPADPGMPDDWEPAPLAWEDCPDAPGAQCATLTVPLVWSEPAGPTIDLAVLRIPATGGDRDRIGSLITNPGGPGASGVDFVAGGALAGSELSRRFDLVGWDPRGVGRSTPLRCNRGVAAFLGEDSSPDSAEEQRRLDTSAAAIAAECAVRHGELLPHLGTAEVARDLEALRRALGDGPLDYLGFSYGTSIGQAYAARFPDRIRTMVLDGVVDPAESFTGALLGQVDGFDAAFDRNAEGCRSAGPERCGVEDLAAAYDEMARRVEERPLRTGGGPVGPSELAVAAIYVGYLDDGWRQLGPALADGLDGRGASLRNLADGYLAFGAFTAYVGVVCVDDAPPVDPDAYRAFADEARARSPRFGAPIANELLPCATWAAEPSEPLEEVTAPGAPPILVVGSTGDPATPFRNAVAVADRLESGVLLTVDADGHTAFGSNACATGVTERYLVDLEVPADGTRC